MREIEFRGKQLHTGKWVYGNYVCDGRYYITQPLIDAHHLVEVDPATVGQLTGLEDISGVEIFEGDIVHCVARTDAGNCVVIFEDGEFRLIPDRHYASYTAGGGFHAIRCFNKRVVGNIHDGLSNGKWQTVWTETFGGGA